MRAWACWLALALAAARARELDPAACAARFDVQRDKIIRTEESRDMGARYLAELDVGSRAECLRLCCETDACDVFVFEEKSPGSCYLFKCGPPEDFRCKFTAHGNFSSGVLALSRRLAELQDQERLAHHEQELANLRQKPHQHEQPNATTGPGCADTTTAASAAAGAAAASAAATSTSVVTTKAITTPPRRCSRYQFECRRGGECIAVYNACDGVPQCADGSDEAPELGCPAPPAPSTTAPPPPPPRPPQQPPQPPQTQERVQVASSERVSAGMPSALLAEVEAPEPEEGGGPDLWPRRLAQAQHRYTGLPAGAGAGGPPHIFSHQGGLLQGAPFAPPAWPRRGWPPDVPPDSPRNEMDTMEVPGGIGGLGGVGAAGGGWGYSRLEPWPDERRAWPVPPRADPEMPVYSPAKTMPELPIYTGQHQALRDSPKKGFELHAQQTAPLSAEQLAAQSTERLAAQLAAQPNPGAQRPLAAQPDLREEKKPNLDENTTKKKALKEKGPEHRAAGGAAAAAVWADEHDGLSEHPPAAVLLLVLGSLLTAALGALLACRARAARRRRRAHPRLALDADYLVNGMYL